MTIFILTFLIVLLAVLGMAVGAIAGRKPIQGGCGKGLETGAGIGCGACGVEGRDGNPMALRERHRSTDGS